MRSGYPYFTASPCSPRVLAYLAYEKLQPNPTVSIRHKKPTTNNATTHLLCRGACHVQVRQHPHCLPKIQRRAASHPQNRAPSALLVNIPCTINYEAVCLRALAPVRRHPLPGSKRRPRCPLPSSGFQSSPGRSPLALRKKRSLYPSPLSSSEAHKDHNRSSNHGQAVTQPPSLCGMSQSDTHTV